MNKHSNDSADYQREAASSVRPLQCAGTTKRMAQSTKGATEVDTATQTRS